MMMVLLDNISLEYLRYLVIDEADTLFMKDFGEELMTLLNHLKVRNCNV
jgi:superfamily II DNA/RNA helicase